jgi:hypothetical protein
MKNRVVLVSALSFVAFLALGSSIFLAAGTRNDAGDSVQFRAEPAPEQDPPVTPTGDDCPTECYTPASCSPCQPRQITFNNDLGVQCCHIGSHEFRCTAPQTVHQVETACSGGCPTAIAAPHCE